MAIAILGLLVPGCSDAEIVDVQLESHRTSCLGLVPHAGVADRSTQQCYALGQITGFSHVWGHEYVLRVEVSDIGDPDEDGPRRRYQLVEVVADTVVAPTSPFGFPMVRYPQLLGPQGQRYNGSISLTGDAGELFDGTPFVCGSAAVCAELASAIADDERRFNVTFGYSPGTTLPLIAHVLHQ